MTVQAGLFPRRSFLRGGIAASVVLGAGGLAAALRAGGYDISPNRLATLQSLHPWQVVVIEHVARRMTEPDRDNDASIVTSDQTDVAGFIDQYASHMPPPLRRDLFRLLGFIEHVSPFLMGASSRFTRLTSGDQDRVLRALESSRHGLLRGGFAAIKSLVFMGYYRDPRTWKILDYDGPRVRRPADGWWQK